MRSSWSLIWAGIIATAFQLVCVDSSPSNNKIDRDEYELGQLCKRIGSFKYISQMEELIEKLRLVQDKQSKHPLDTTPDLSNAFKRLLQSPMAPCLRQAESIMELAEIIKERENVCSSQHLDLMERYYDKYVKPSLTLCDPSNKPRLIFPSICTTNKPVTSKFFQLYANQVSFSCKANLLSSLKTIDAKHLASDEDYTKALPWLSNSSTKLCNKIEKLEKLAADLGGEQQELFSEEFTDTSKERALQCKAVRAISEISTVHELVEAFERENHISVTYPDSTFTNNIILGEHGQESEGQDAAGQSGLFLIVPREQRSVVIDMQEGCSSLRPIYEQIVQPIVRLIRMGFNPTFANFDKLCSENKLIQKWFGITLVCSSILSSHLTDIDKYSELKKDFEANKKSLVVIDEESSEDRNAPSPSPSDVLSLVKYPIEDELWVYKYGTTKVQRFKDGVLKKVLKLLKVEDIDDHILLRRNIAGINGWIVKGVILTVSLLTLR